MNIKILAMKLENVLDTYELRDTDTTTEDIEKDLINNPLDIINYLLTMIENERS